MATTNYYGLLGVPHDAKPAQIKTAWRRFAREHHPDLNADPASQSKFKAASEAYATLSVPAKRAAYDASWSGGAPGFVASDFSGAGSGGMEDFFTSFFSSSASPPLYGLNLTLREAARGGPRHFTLHDGTPLSVELPPGVEDGTWLSYPQARIEIHVLPDENFQVLDRDLFTTIPLPLALALNGGELPMSTLLGHVNLKIGPFTKSGTRFRLRRQGLPSPSGGAQGDLYVQVNIVLPTPDAALKRWAKNMPNPAEGKTK